MYNKPKLAAVLSVFILSTFCLPGAVKAGLDSQVLEEKLAKIAAYDYGQSRETLTEITDIVRAAYNCPQDLKVIEKHFLEFLGSDATPASKQFICRELSVIGTEEAVPTLAPMLTDTATSDMARYALERIPGSAVDQALRDALPKTTGKIKVGIIASLGVRRDCKSVPALRDLIGDSDAAVAAAAVSALGQIADSQATEALAEAKEKTSGKLQQLVLDAYLKCADKLVGAGQGTQALTIYEQLYAKGEPEPIRFAALRGIVMARPEKATETIIDVLRSKDEAMKAVAIGLIKEVPGEKIIKYTAAELPRLSAISQIQLLSALSDRGDPNALFAAVKATDGPNVDVRAAAFKALGSLGDASTVDLLALAAAKKKGAEQEAARESLYRLRGPKIDDVILSRISEDVPKKVRAELVRSIGQRYVQKGVKTLLGTTKDSDPNVQFESYKALRIIADEKYLPELVDLLMRRLGETVRGEAENTVVAVAHKIAEENRRASAVLAVLPSAKLVPIKCSLLSVLGKIGDNSALPVLRTALEEKDIKVKDAAVRALSDWPNAEPMADLLKIARSSGDEKHRILALRGYVRMIGLSKDRPATETIEMYKQAMDLTANEEVRKQVLSGLANVKDFTALQMAVAYLEDKALQQEAEAAVVKIAEATQKDHPEETKAAIEKVLKTTENKSLREQAEKLLKEIK